MSLCFYSQGSDDVVDGSGVTSDAQSAELHARIKVQYKN